ncbi:MAG TPA: AMP-binding protein, partial [Conexibacter sp.]|nr:AMP-binding protein [Conexibacter sp.]
TRFEQASWGSVVRDAAQMTAGLRRAGVRPGTAVAALLTNTPLTVRGMLGVWLAGGALASLPIPARGMSAQEYGVQLRTICEQLGPVALLADAELVPQLPPTLADVATVHAWESFAGSGAVAPTPPGRDELAFVQYSSGSTRTPKGCMLTTRAIEAQIDLLEDLMRPVRGQELGLSWLPLSHDMGMFGGLLSCWAHGSPFVLSTPQRFMLAPSTWLTDAARFGATITGGPDTALRLAARAVRAHRLPDRLRLRVCIVGAERVHAETLAFAVERLAPYGFDATALMPAYGLAEAVVAVTGTPHDEAPRVLSVDALALAEGRIEELPQDAPAASRIVGAGPPGLGAELVGLERDRVGEIRVRTRSLATGYFGEPELTRERFRDGELLTGDLGFVRDGHLYPVGRLDDVISVAGRSVYTREIEAAVDRLEAVRPGCAAVVEHPRDGRLVLVLELRRADADHRALADDCAQIALAKAGVALDACVFLRKGSLPKTPSGKIQRHRARQLLGLDGLEPVASVDFGTVAGG